MTAKQFRKKFPDAPTNDNCLTDIACGKCGNRDRFNVEVKTVVEMSDMGTDDHGDTEHDGKSYMCCLGCGKEGTVKSFTIKGLDTA